MAIGYLDGVQVTVPDPLPPNLAQVQAQLQNRLGAIYAQKIVTGYPAGSGLSVMIDDGSRADLTGMAVTASLASQTGSGIAWPPSYSQGWIAIGGTRIPLATPADGIALAYGAGVYYSKLAQNEQTLSDAITALTDATKTVDLTQGWPAT